MTTVNEVVFFYVISKQTHTGKQLQPVGAFEKKENFILKINQKHSNFKPENNLQKKIYVNHANN